MAGVTAPARLRMSRTSLIPVALLFVCVIPLATAQLWTLVFLAVPLVVAVWALRTGVDIDESAVTVRGAIGSRRVPWAQLAGIRIGERRSLWLVTTEGTEVRLPVLRVGDLPRLAALSGGRIQTPEPAA